MKKGEAVETKGEAVETKEDFDVNALIKDYKDSVRTKLITRAVLIARINHTCFLPSTKEVVEITVDVPYGCTKAERQEILAVNLAKTYGKKSEGYKEIEFNVISAYEKTCKIPLEQFIKVSNMFEKEKEDE